MRIRAFLILLLLLSGCPSRAVAGDDALRIGITPAILHDQHQTMTALRQYLERKTSRAIELVPRNRYRDTMDLVRQGEVEFAWVSAFPYVYMRRHSRIQLVAVPLLKGRPTFRAYLIVPADDQATRGVLDLGGRIFAYADLYSFTGYVVPRHELKAAGRDPARFFGRTFFTYGHKKAIRAVASGLADGASVDSFVWDALSMLEPELTAATRIAARSPEYGAPPIVATEKVGKTEVAAIRKALVGMAKDPEGIKLLKSMGMDGFVAGDPRAYAEVERMMGLTGDL